jgi:hypothetical protein
MKTIVINTEKELKSFVKENRKNITNINGIECNELYPMLDISNKHAMYYDVKSQENKIISAPFNIQLND